MSAPEVSPRLCAWPLLRPWPLAAPLPLWSHCPALLLLCPMLSPEQALARPGLCDAAVPSTCLRALPCLCLLCALNPCMPRAPSHLLPALPGLVTRSSAPWWCLLSQPWMQVSGRPQAWPTRQVDAVCLDPGLGAARLCAWCPDCSECGCMLSPQCLPMNQGGSS